MKKDLDRIIAQAKKAQQERARSYREQALKLLPWICGRCAREFGSERLRELTVHHKDGDHDNNPPDGSNWELLCVYCHENEHARVEDAKAGVSAQKEKQNRDSDPKSSTYRPLEDLAKLLKKKE
jgi:hypothetical protein